MAPEPDRTPRYRKNPAVDRVLGAVNERLADLERELIAPFDAPRHPTLFIVGAPRSGTTLLIQLLLARFEFGRIDNLTARFWLAPYIGALLAGQLGEAAGLPAVGLESDLGATRGFDGPHEFGYFWRRWLRFGETHDAPDTRTADGRMLRQELAAVESVLDRPLVLKNLVCGFHIDFLARTLPRSIFVHCRREAVYAAQSILRARMKYYGDRNAWFSLRPAEFGRLRGLDYAQQIAGQVLFTRARIERQLQRLPAGRRLRVDYEAICDAPAEALDRIAACVAGSGYALVRRPLALPAVVSTNRASVDPVEFEALRRACDSFAAAAEQETGDS